MKKAILIFLLLLLATNQVSTQTASILPQGVTQYLDSNGNPVASGKVYNYIVGTTTFKTTWQDSGEVTANSNPVTLDAAGRAKILGQGAYRQIVRKANGDLVFDAVTTSTGSGSGSTATGDGDLVGTVKPWAGLTAPNQYVFAYGQELNRTTYATLYTAITQTLNINCTSTSTTLSGISDTTSITIGATIEASCIPAGTIVISKTSSAVIVSNPASLTVVTTGTFYPFGAGNGSTTFNLPDLRDLVIAGRPNMGGTDRGLLTTAYYDTNPAALGATGGQQTYTLITGNLPAYTPAGTIAITDPGHNHVNNSAAVLGSASTVGGGGNPNVFPGTGFAITNTSNTTGVTAGFTGTAQGGTSTPFSRIQPTMTLNYIIKITPDTNSTTASGVTSLGSMTGDIACGTGLLCTGNIISFTGAASLPLTQNYLYQGNASNIAIGVNIAPFTPVVSPIGASATGHVIPWLDENWVQAADTYSIASSDPHVLPVTALLSGTVSATFTIRLQWGANDISKTTTGNASLAAAAADLTTKLQADATIAAANINIQYNSPVNSALILITPPYTITLTVSSTGAGTITVGGSPTSNILDANPIIALGRSIAGRPAQTNDSIGSFFWYGQDSTGNLGTNGLGTVPYAGLIGTVQTPTAGNVAGQIYFATAQANTINVRFAAAAGLYMFSSTVPTIGGDPGAGGIGADLIRIRNANTSIAGIFSRNSAAAPTAISSAVLQTVGTTGAANSFEMDGEAATSQIILRRTNGTFAIPTAIANNDVFGNISAGGYDGVVYRNNQASVYFVATGLWASGDTPTEIQFTTTPSASATELARLKIAKDGGIFTTNASGGSKGIDTVNALSMYARNFIGLGSSSGSLTIKPAAVAGANTLTITAGTTDFSATGGTSQVVKQTLSGGAFTVARLACADLSDAAATCSSASAESLVVGTTVISSGTTTRILYDNAGILGEYTLTGTGTVVAMQTAPLFLATAGITPPSAFAATVGVRFANNAGIAMQADAQASNVTWALRRTNGTFASPSALGISDTIFGISAGGYDGVTYRNAQGSIYFVTSGVWASGDTPTSLIFTTTPAGSATEVTRFTIGPTGSISFNAYGTGILHSSSIGAITSSAVDLSSADATGTLAAARFPALTGDMTTSAGNLATTLATVASAGTTGSSTAIPVITINVKGLTTSITTAAVVAPAGTLTGATLASGVTASSLTSFGTSPALTGTPTAPTAAVGTNTTQIATTAFVQATTAIVKIQKFTADGTYTPSTGMVSGYAECWGAGAGGGAVTGTIAFNLGGAGGGSGSYSRWRFTAATIGASKLVKIGTGGAGGAAGNNAGANGGDACLTTSTCVSGQLIAGKGGTGGSFSNNAVLGSPGLGGVAGTGDDTGTGAPGFMGIYTNATGVSFGGGAGGSCDIGGGGIAANATGAGANAPGVCGGGAGGYVNNSTSNVAGGNGGNGYCRVTEFVNQ